MRLSRYVPGNQVAFELAHHDSRAMAAHADEADASLRQSLNGRDSDILGQATRRYLLFIERDEQRAAHRLSPRLAAAMASRR